jgi:hypothetical protein
LRSPRATMANDSHTAWEGAPATSVASMPLRGDRNQGWEQFGDEQSTGR